MFLWQKESTGNDACYIDFLLDQTADDFKYQFMKTMYQNVMHKKSDVQAIELRMRGNQQVEVKNWRDAMELYNQSLRHAVNGTENISLAYANRSICFLQMQKYDQCRTDIELAKKANYPQRLMHKLDEREAKCLKLMMKNQPHENPTKLQLSFDADEKFPCLANVLEIRNNEKLGQHIVAKRDIDVGKIVVVEDLFITSTHSETQAFCKTCLKSAQNFVPCPNCIEFMFCNTKCMVSGNIHAMSCNALHDQDNFDSVRMVESILIAATAFPNVGALMEFVANALATPDFDTPECNTDVQKTYRMFLKLKFNAPPEEMIDGTKRVIFWSYQMLMDMANIQRDFQSKRERRFLMHLLLQHHLILIANGTLFHEHELDTNRKVYQVSGTAVFASLFNVSCVSNVSILRHGHQTFILVVRPVKKGEQLTIVGKSDDRQCKCSKCIPIWKQEDEYRFVSEPDYRYIMEFHTDDFNDPVHGPILKEKMVMLLNKYGRLPWSPELESFVVLFDHCMQAEFSI